MSTENIVKCVPDFFALDLTCSTFSGKTGPIVVQATLLRIAKIPSRLIVLGLTKRWESKCKRKYASSTLSAGLDKSLITVLTTFNSLALTKSFLS